jgi:hypothetical protein
MIDYAMPTMMAEKALKDLHDAMLMQKYDDALEFALVAIAETRMAYNAIVVMKDAARGK